jgi:trimeric autotransporter adhesin
MYRTLTILFIIASSFAYAQDITNTLGVDGTFTIKNQALTDLVKVSSNGNFTNTLGADGTFRIKNQVLTDLMKVDPNGDVTLSKDFKLPNSAGIFFGDQRFIHCTGSNSENVFIGQNVGNLSVTGMSNVGIGNYALTGLTSGHWNIAMGKDVMRHLADGSGNIAIGYSSGSGIQTGSNNIFIGYEAGYSPAGSNNIAIGTNANVSGSNQVQIGSGITYAGINVPWTVSSDRKWKTDIKGSDLGLNFIGILNPVSYTRINDEKQKVEYGFIAQEVELGLKQLGAENTGMINIDEKGNYELRYNDLIAPMIKAIQELKQENDELRSLIENLESKYRILATEKD